ncbi:MgtC/SapB family protein [Anaerosporobacter faecicola]|uniref:MgtC/SapB family protein n=1 Tax=Anaerosporobacter faecicola TaxID=2718714 RepID=UPI00143B4E39|nr:MgtC/SapB family protein [Anaerosporobacter faecicola]
MGIEFVGNLRDINYLSIMVRMILALLCGGIIGYDREKKGRPAGFRTHILVCIGSTLVMMTGQFIIDIQHMSTDPARLGAQVISGIGFLGAGTILITSKQHVKGLTTAAGLWACACMGLAIGIGFYEGAILGCIFILASMKVLQGFDAILLSKADVIELYIELTGVEGIGEVLGLLKENHLSIIHCETVTSKECNTSIGLFVTASKLKDLPTEEVLDIIKNHEMVATAYHI